MTQLGGEGPDRLSRTPTGMVQNVGDGSLFHLVPEHPVLRRPEPTSRSKILYNGFVAFRRRMVGGNPCPS